MGLDIVQNDSGYIGTTVAISFGEDVPVIPVDVTASEQFCCATCATPSRKIMGRDVTCPEKDCKCATTYCPWTYLGL